MDEHAKHIALAFNKKILRKEFDQHDLEHFYLATRDYSLRKSAPREIGDFLAHPKLKTQGETIQSINKSRCDYEEHLRNIYTGQTEEPFTFNGFGGSKKIIEGINKIFLDAGIKSKHTIKNGSQESREIIFCTIFSLGEFKLETEKHKTNSLDIEISNNTSLELSTTIESKIYKNHTAKLRLLSVQINKSHANNTRIKTSSLIARRFKEGFLGAISYMDDIKAEEIRISQFKEKSYIALNEI